MDLRCSFRIGRIDQTEDLPSAVGGILYAHVAAALGKPAAVRGLLIALWVILALALSGTVDAPAELALAFLAGGVVAGIGVWISGSIHPSPSSGKEKPPLFSTLVGELWTPLGQFALIRGLSAGLATYVGIVLFPDFPISRSGS